jgi:hypothetical protein
MKPCSTWKEVATDRFVLELMKAIRGGGARGEEGALVLGLLIEREKVGATAHASYHESLAELLDPTLIARRLSRSEVKMAVDQLIAYVERPATPIAGAVWALSKCHQRRVVPHLARVLEHHAVDVSVARNALSGLMALGDDPRARSVIARATTSGSPEIRQSAQDFLAHLKRVPRKAR